MNLRVFLVLSRKTLPLSFWLSQSQCAASQKSENAAGDLQRCQNNDLLLHASIHLGRSWNSKGFLNINLIWIHLTFEKMEYVPTMKEDS